MRFKDYGFVLTAIIGLGLAVPENVTIDYAQLDGGQDVYTRKPTRTFSLAGRFEADSYFQLRQNRSAVTSVLDRDRAPLDQTLVLLHHLEDRCGNVLGDEARIVCKYQGGLGGNTQAISGEVASMQFQQVLPLVLSDREAGASLSVQQSVTAPSALLRDANGVWSSPTGWGTATIALAFAVGTDQTLYAGTSASNFFWQLSGTAWSAIGALNGSVRAFAVDANGDVYLTGDFTSPQTRIMKYVPGTGTFSAMGSGLNGVGRSLAIDPVNRKLYVVGDFTTAGGGAANRIAVWDLDAGTWAAVGAGLATPGFGVVYAANRMIYALANGDSGANAVRLYSWDGSSLAVVATSGAVTDLARALVLGADNLLYGGGTFTTIGGRTVNNVFYYDYNAIQALGTGVTGGVSRLALRARGGVTLGGAFTAAGGMTLLDGIVDWTGANGTYLQVDADLPIGTVQALASGRDGSLYIGYNSVSSAAVTSAQTTVTNPGTVRSYPTMTFKGPTSGKSRIYQVINYTTGTILYLNYTINAGETAVFQFDPLNQSFTSDFQGNLFSMFQAGSSQADFFLAPGTNRISCFAADSTVTAIIAWRPLYGSLDDR